MIEAINGESNTGQQQQSFFVLSKGQSVEVEVTNARQWIERREREIERERSLQALKSSQNNEPTDEQLLQMDLNEIVHNKGLRDLDLIEKVLAAKERRDALVRERRRQIQLKVEEAAREQRAQ